mmetsp:Transcript_22676/g.33563  ORF Transcript_22676/g.33563 Transcript_22676/m.33563 type:complete len:112 (+) Transcript_22676:391-726(+)
MSCDAGKAITFGAMMEQNDPTSTLVFIMTAGTTANVVKASEEACTVIEIPEIMHAMDTKAPTKGPLIATSKSAFLVFGNDRNGVIDPNVPICNDGSGTGRPILTSDFDAAI